MTELQQCEYDAASKRFRDLRGAFKGMHCSKFVQYIDRVEAGLKSNTRCFFKFKFANLKRNSTGYPSAMFLGDACAQEIADLFGVYIQGVYVRDNSQEGFIMDGGVEEETVGRGIVALDTKKGPEPDGIPLLILKKIVLVVKSPLNVLFNLLLLSAVFPCVWKESYVISLFKSGDIF
jgi:hypothetical protein